MRRHSHPRRRPLRVVAVVVATSCLFVPQAGAAPGAPKPPSSSARLKELQDQRDQVRAAKARTASSVDALQASDTEIQTALTDLANNIEGQSALLEEAQRAVAAAEAEKASADAAVEKATADLATLRTSIKQQAIDAYVHAPAEDSLSFLTAEDLSLASREQTLRELQATNGLDAAEHMREVQEDLNIAKLQSADAAQRATDRKAEVSDRLTKLQAAQAEQETFAAAVDARIEAALAESDSLAQLDTALSAQVASQQRAILDQLAAQRAANARRGRTSTPGGGSLPPINTGGGANITTVRGIRVHSSIAGNLESMLAAAEAAGISMSGGGYRDPAGQIAVRRSNCGSSNYAIYQMPASACSPPTARPGSSMHERGLAIDFTQGGRTLNRGSSAFHWLKANAGSYGFHNLPSEPWHWSTNGN